MKNGHENDSDRNRIPSRKEACLEKEMLYAHIIKTASVLFLVLVMAALSLVIEKPEVSQIEKRELAKEPKLSAESWLDGSYAEKYDLYYSDTFPFRELLTSAATWIRSAMGLQFGGMRYVPSSQDTEQTTAPLQHQTDPEPENDIQTEPDESSSKPEEDFTVGVEQVNGILISNGRALQVFGGIYSMGEWYASVINSYRAALDDSVRMYSVVVPTATQYYLSGRFRSMSGDEIKAINDIYAQLAPGITPVDVYTVLGEHTDEYIYFNTDHHWTGRGAYYAYTSFAKAANFTPKELAGYNTHYLDSFLGTLYSATLDRSLYDNPDYVEYYDIPIEYEAYRFNRGAPFTPVPTTLLGEYASGQNSYSVFLHGDFPLIKVITANKNGRKALVVKESYGNAFSTFLVPHYEELYIVDERYFELNLVSYIKENRITDVIFINNVFAAYTPYHIRRIDTIFRQSYVPAQAAPPAQVQEPEPEEEQEEEREDDPEESSSGEEPVKPVVPVKPVEPVRPQTYQ